MIQELKKEPFTQKVYCVKCFGEMTITVPPEESATEAMLAWIHSDKLCPACRKKKEAK